MSQGESFLTRASGKQFASKLSRRAPGNISNLYDPGTHKEMSQRGARLLRWEMARHFRQILLLEPSCSGLHRLRPHPCMAKDSATVLLRWEMACHFRR